MVCVAPHRTCVLCCPALPVLCCPVALCAAHRAVLRRALPCVCCATLHCAVHGTMLGVLCRTAPCRAPLYVVCVVLRTKVRAALHGVVLHSTLRFACCATQPSAVHRVALCVPCCAAPRVLRCSGLCAACCTAHVCCARTVCARLCRCTPYVLCRTALCVLFFSALCVLCLALTHCARCSALHCTALRELRRPALCVPCCSAWHRTTHSVALRGAGFAAPHSLCLLWHTASCVRFSPHGPAVPHGTARAVRHLSVCNVLSQYCLVCAAQHRSVLCTAFYCACCAALQLSANHMAPVHAVLFGTVCLAPHRKCVLCRSALRALCCAAVLFAAHCTLLRSALHRLSCATLRCAVQCTTMRVLCRIALSCPLRYIVCVVPHSTALCCALHCALRAVLHCSLQRTNLLCA